MEKKRQIGVKRERRVQDIIDGANELNINMYLPGIISGDIKVRLSENRAKENTITDKRNNRPDFSDLGIGI